MVYPSTSAEPPNISLSVLVDRLLRYLCNNFIARMSSTRLQRAHKPHTRVQRQTRVQYDTARQLNTIPLIFRTLKPLVESRLHPSHPFAPPTPYVQYHTIAQYLQPLTQQRPNPLRVQILQRRPRTLGLLDGSGGSGRTISRSGRFLCE